MKIKLLSIVFAIMALTSCTDQNQTTNEQSGMPTVPGQMPANPTGLEGTWINKKYADELKKTGSPKASQQSANITMLVLPREIPTMVLIICNFHEGNNTFLKATNGGFEFDQSSSSDQTETLRMDNGTLKTSTEEFIRLEELNQKQDYYVGELLLFAGKYDLNGKSIEFTKDGRIIGLDEFTYYSVILDYFDAAMDVDQLRLGTSPEKNKNYGFIYSKNVLTIYELDCEDNECTKVKNGKELYRLVKQ